MRKITLWSLGVCAACAVLAQAQAPRSDRAPDPRTFVPQDAKQSANTLAPRPGQRSFTEAPDRRTLLAEPSVRHVAEDGGSKYTAGGIDPRSLGRDLRDSGAAHDTALARPAPGEKPNVLPELAESRHLTESAAPRGYRPDERPVKNGYLDRQSERR